MKKIYICDCQKKKTKDIQYGIFKETSVNKEGICLKCGHYATLKTDDRFSVNKRIDARQDPDEDWIYW